jgi:hypothetical protein
MPEEEKLKQPIVSFKTGVATTLSILALIGAIITADSRYAKPEALAQQEKQTVQTLQQFKMDMDRDRAQQAADRARLEQDRKRDMLQQRYMFLTDQSLQLKTLHKKYPKDSEIKEEYEKATRERDDVKRQLDVMYK